MDIPPPPDSVQAHYTLDEAKFVLEAENPLVGKAGLFLVFALALAPVLMIFLGDIFSPMVAVVAGGTILMASAPVFWFVACRYSTERTLRITAKNVVFREFASGWTLPTGDIRVVSLGEVGDEVRVQTVRGAFSVTGLKSREVAEWMVELLRAASSQDLGTEKDIPAALDVVARQARAKSRQGE